MPILKYRLHGNRPPPQPIQLAIPGWGGAAQPRADGSHEQPWHCTPFSESARYGVEVLYPFDEELRVRTVRGKVRLEAEWGEPADLDMMWPPFRPFGADYYSYQLSLDLEAPKGWAVRAEPHPRYFTDPTNHHAALGGARPGAQRVVADDVLLHLQGAAQGRHPCLPQG